MSGGLTLACRGDAGATRRAADAAGVDLVAEADADAVLAVGDDGVRSLAATPPEAPALAVGDGLGDHGTTEAGLGDAVEALAAGDYRRVDHPVLGVAVDGETAGRAVRDVTLVTAEPARISEYRLAAGDDRGPAFRADGVVVATPLGSDGYAAAAGGPTLGTDTGVAVVPVAPFSTRAGVRVLDPPLSLSVARDEGEVTLVVDGEASRAVPHGVPVRLSRAGTVTLLRPSPADR
jgi:NAD+ kinase